MKILLFFIIFISINACSSLRVKRFINGFAAKNGQFPYIVSIHNKKDNTQFCAGAIIDRRYILTAAHCLDLYSSKYLYISAGSVNLYTGGKKYYVKKSVVHHHYNNITFKNDIGLLKLTKKIKLSKYVQEISIAMNEPPDNSILQVAGWGLIHQTSFISITTNNLQYAYINKMSYTQCRKLIHKVDKTHPVTKKHICTNNRFDFGICEGDSGGPLVYNNTVVGVISWALGCGTGFPDIYTYIPAYYNWIKSQMRKM